MEISVVQQLNQIIGGEHQNHYHNWTANKNSAIGTQMM